MLNVTFSMIFKHRDLQILTNFYYSVTPNSMPPEMNKPTPITSVANRSKIPSTQDSPLKKNVSSAKSDGKSESVGSGGVGNGGSTAHGTSSSAGGGGTSVNATSESREKVTGKSKLFHTV